MNRLIAAWFQIACVVPFLNVAPASICAAQENNYDGSLDGTWEVISFARDGEDVFTGSLREVLVLKKVVDNKLSWKLFSSSGAEYIPDPLIIDGARHEDYLSKTLHEAEAKEKIRNLSERICYIYTWDGSNGILQYETYQGEKKKASGCYYKIGRDILVRYYRKEGKSGEGYYSYRYKLVDSIPWDVNKAKQNKFQKFFCDLKD